MKSIQLITLFALSVLFIQCKKENEPESKVPIHENYINSELTTKKILKSFKENSNVYLLSETYNESPFYSEIIKYSNGEFEYSNPFSSSIYDLCFYQNEYFTLNEDNSVNNSSNLNSFNTIYNGDYNFRCMAVENKNKIWLGSSGSGLWLLSDTAIVNYNMDNSDIKSNYVIDIKIDKTNDITWVVLGRNGRHEFYGLLKIQNDIWTYVDFTEQIPEQIYRLSGIEFDKNNRLWMEYNEKLLVFDDSIINISEPDDISENRVSWLVKIKNTGNGDMWAMYAWRETLESSVHYYDFYVYKNDLWIKELSKLWSIYNQDFEVVNDTLWIFNLGIEKYKLN
jgi:hypothetical protein